MMRQEFKNYNQEDFNVWSTLFARQQENLKDKSCAAYLTCLDNMKEVLNEKSIPQFAEMNQILLKETGWSIEVVPGLIPVEDFFELLSQKRFCSSTWLRTMKQLDYLEEPDMFHDIFGHIPMFMNKAYGNFAQKMGKIGVAFKDSEEVLLQLQRIYWFTIEFGLINELGPKIYGAGLVSSFGETNSIFEEGVEILPFNLDEIIETDFCNSEMQSKYFLLNSLEDLYEAFDKYELSLMEITIV